MKSTLEHSEVDFFIYRQDNEIGKNQLINDFII